jgi:hypothetical protein
MAEDFNYDVFLSHSSKDKDIVRDVAERLRADGLRVWFDEWEIKPGDSIPSKVDDGLEQSRVLVLCMSAHAFGSDWASLESYTYRFRDPLNKERCFIPLRLDDEPIKNSLAQFLYINWVLEGSETEYMKLLDACRPPKSNILPFKGTLPLKPKTKLEPDNPYKTSRRKIKATARDGGIAFAADTINISYKTPAPKSQGNKYPANSIGSDANLVNYIDYLCDLYVRYVKTIEPDERRSHQKIGTQIKNRFRLRKTRNYLSVERFPELVDYLINEKLAKTPVGRKHLLAGTLLCRTYEDYRYGKM